MANFSESERQFFDCRRCGHCCQGKGGIVVSAVDLRRLCVFLQTTADDFERTFGERRSGKLHIRADNSATCVFFKQGAGCAVHEAKPDICKAWPYFRGNLVDAGSFALCKDFCPGIPPSLSHTDFICQGLNWLAGENLVGTAGPDEANALQVTDLVASLAKNDKKR